MIRTIQPRKQLFGRWRGAGLGGVAVGDDTPIRRRASESVEHGVSGSGDFSDGIFSVALAGEIGGHEAENVGAIAEENDAGIVADGFEFAGLIGDLQVVG